MDLYRPKGFSGTIVAEIPKRTIARLDLDLCEQPRETLKHYYDRQKKKPDILVNGGFFGMKDGSTCFDFMDEYQLIHEDPTLDHGMGVIDTNILKFGTMSGRTDWRDFVSAYPVLVYRGQPVVSNIGKEIDYPARRTLLGYNQDSVFLVAVDDDRLNFRECQNLALTLGMDYTINLDGGGSTKMLVNGKNQTSPLYNRPVDSVFAVYLKSADPHKTIYRVQTGAFSTKANADRLCAEIRALPDRINAGYAKAYVRLIDGLYKVQVGAFSVKDNAYRVATDLKSLGYSCFVTAK